MHEKSIGFTTEQRFSMSWLAQGADLQQTWQDELADRAHLDVRFDVFGQAVEDRNRGIPDGCCHHARWHNESNAVRQWL